MTKDEMIGIGQRLKNAREPKGLSRDVMANELGVSLRHYDRIERGESQITTQHVFKIKSLTDIG